MILKYDHDSRVKLSLLCTTAASYILINSNVSFKKGYEIQLIITCCITRKSVIANYKSQFIKRYTCNTNYYPYCWAQIFTYPIWKAQTSLRQVTPEAKVGTSYFDFFRVSGQIRTDV